MKKRGAPDEPDYIVNLSSLEHGREPFAETIDDELFCFDSGRNQRLNLLLHLAPYSELLLVTGEPGSGKTSLLRQFALRAASRWKIARVVADATMSVGMLVRRICDEAGVVLNDVGEEPVTLLADHIHLLGLGDKSLILIIDDAHELAGEALAIIDQLLTVSDSCGRPLTVILSGGPQTQDLINHPDRKTLARRCSHTLDLPPLTEQETGDYVRHRLTVCGYDPAALSTATIRKIHKASGGVPARINQFAGWLALAAVLVVAFFYWPKGVDEPPSPPASTARMPEQARVERPGSAPVVADRDQPVAAQPPDPLTAAGDADSAAATAGEDILVEVPPAVEVTAVSEAEPLDPVEITPEPVSPPPPEVAAAPLMASSETAAATEPGVPQPAVRQPSVPTVTEPAIPAPTAVVTAAAPVTQAPAIPDTVPALQGAIPEPSGARTEKPAVTVASPEPPRSATAGAPNREAWLLQQLPGHFTLQLMSSGKEASIISFIKKRRLESDTAYFRTLRNGKDWYAVVYSIYPSLDAAVAAAGQLPDSLSDIKPWVRGMDSIHADITAAGPAR
ncbi:MAG: DamX protein [Gammaproteobacteria bacterium]|nr:MAG: DamX protein [Gammaproteobacteria bacterium]